MGLEWELFPPSVWPSVCWRNVWNLCNPPPIKITPEWQDFMKICLLSYYYFFHVSAKNWAARCRISSRCRCIPFSKLCTIDFILMCKCNGLQANPIRDSWCFSRPHKAPCARFEFHLTGLLHQIKFHAVIWQCRFKRQCRSRVTGRAMLGAILCLRAASECTCFSFLSVEVWRKCPH